MKLPPAARWLLQHTLPPGARGQTMLGDLIEELDARNRGPAAFWWCWRQTLSLAGRFGWRRLRHLDPEGGRRKEHRPMALDSWRQDVRYAVRTFAKAPTFTAVVLVTLALGIGASTAIFSLVNGILLRPLPYPEPDRLVYLNEARPDGAQMSVSWPNFVDWRARQHSFDALALSRTESMTLTGLDYPERVRGRRTTGSFFNVLGVKPAIGRLFTDEQDRADTPAIVVVSHAFWQRRLGGASNALGRALILNGRSYEVAGVLPAEFRYLGRDYDVFVPIGLLVASNPYLLDRGNHQGYVGVGRLKPGVSLAAARTEMQAIGASLQREYPETNTNVEVKTTPLAAQLVSDVRLTLLVLFGAVGCLLVIACVNVANLLVARGAARQHELGVRAALGGGRARLVRQLLVESSLVSMAGGALGILLGSGLLQGLLALAPDGTPRLDEVSLDATAVLFAFASALVCGLAFGAFPALHASGIRGQQLLVRMRTSGASARSHRLRRGLMVVEVALALVLLAGAGLMVRTLQRLTAVNTGFRPDHLLTMRFMLTGEQWRDDGRRAAFLDQVLDSMRSVPSVTDAALADSLPIDGSNWNSIFIVRDKPVPPRALLPSAAFTPVSASYLETMGMRLVSGRFIDATDTAGGPKTVVVNEALAKRLWPGENAVGKLLKQGWPESPTPWRQVVGVVGDVKFDGVAEATPLQVYLPMSQEPSDGPALVVRTAGPSAAARSGVEAAVHRLNPDIPLYDVQTMDDVLSASLAQQRISMIVMVVFAAVALTLAAVGLYGVVSHGVTERRHEIGVRMALGADRAHVLGLVVRQGLTTALAGVAIGLTAAAALSRSIQGLLFGVTATDPLTFGSVAAMLLGVTFVACYLPARRAARVDPTEALRSE
ncbi:MAG: ABC transporter permease [Betaproteobacteria bacterium]